ncbi:MAG: hypothetical protein IPP72_05305 [Chitinophagaceae bacterium]|nr:hypothetical protein [Chitinophagaceae bacterium]
MFFRLNEHQKNLTRNLLNIRGWQSKRQIVVIESDDWGTIRVSSKDAYNHFLKNGLPVNECPYNSNDALENNEDMELLFETLASVKDKNGNPAIITANNIVANPDFEKIKASGYQQYFYEPFTATYQRYPHHDRVMQLYKEGIEKKLLMPQFHGREHVNVVRWLKMLQEGDKSTLLAFEQSMFSIHAERKPAVVNELMDALDGDTEEELKTKAAIVTEGLDLFNNIWGFPSKSFIAPCYIWQTALEPVLAKNSVQYLQGMVIQLEPVATPGYQYKRRYHYQGQKNKLGQHYLVRNAFFEPTTNPQFDWVDDCLHRIEVAFRWKKPAIISTHRLNFMGGLRPENRAQNLALFAKLLKAITQRWPQTEFMSSDQLGDLINQKK